MIGWHRVQFINCKELLTDANIKKKHTVHYNYTSPHMQQLHENSLTVECMWCINYSDLDPPVLSQCFKLHLTSTLMSGRLHGPALTNERDTVTYDF